MSFWLELFFSFLPLTLLKFTTLKTSASGRSKSHRFTVFSSLLRNWRKSLESESECRLLSRPDLKVCFSLVQWFFSTAWALGSVRPLRMTCFFADSAYQVVCSLRLQSLI
jgi:hypothetical protein